VTLDYRDVRKNQGFVIVDRAKCSVHRSGPKRHFSDGILRGQP
jgi:hypothetical protein